MKKNYTDKLNINTRLTCNKKWLKKKNCEKKNTEVY